MQNNIFFGVGTPDPAVTLGQNGGDYYVDVWYAGVYRWTSAGKWVKTPSCIPTYGTNLSSSNFALSGWGNAASVTGISGTDSAWVCTVNCSGSGILSDPTLVLTFSAGVQWADPPICVTKIIGGSGNVSDLVEVATQNALTVTYLGTPVSGSTYILSGHTVGRSSGSTY